MLQAFFLILMVLRYIAASVSFDQAHQVIHLSLQVDALIRFRDLHTLLKHLKNHRVVINISISLQRFLLTRKRLMGNHTKMSGIEDQSVTGYTGSRLISAAETSVNNQQFTASLNGTLTFFGLHRHMTVDYMAMLPFQTEFF